MNKYRVYYFNRFANQMQVFNVIAKNEYRAGRLFYRKYPRSLYKACIEYIIQADNERYWTEEEIDKHAQVRDLQLKIRRSLK